MANIGNYGLKALVAASTVPGVPSDQEPNLEKVNNKLDPSHKLDKAAFDAICRDLAKNPIANGASSGDKQRDEGNFERVVEEAFKAFRDQEREITLNAPEGSCVDSDVRSRTDDRPSDKFWTGAAHLRHHLEFLLVLKGVKPCVLFLKYALENSPLFSTVVIDCLIPIMDRFDLWSYGFRISVESGHWVFYDARSPKMPLINKVFLTHPTVKRMDPATYHKDNLYGVPMKEVAEALGYPIVFNDLQGSKWVCIRDVTEEKVLNAMGRPQDAYSVQGMAFYCPVGDDAVWMKVLDFYHQCVEAVRGMDTKLTLFTGRCDEMTVWLLDNPEKLDAPVEVLGPGEPTINQMVAFSNTCDKKLLAEAVKLEQALQKAEELGLPETQELEDMMEKMAIKLLDGNGDLKKFLDTDGRIEDLE